MTDLEDSGLHPEAVEVLENAFGLPEGWIWVSYWGRAQRTIGIFKCEIRLDSNYGPEKWQATVSVSDGAFIDASKSLTVPGDLRHGNEAALECEALIPKLQEFARMIGEAESK